MKFCVGFLSLLLLGYTNQTGAQVAADSILRAEIYRIKAIDNHSHGMPAGFMTQHTRDQSDPIGKTAFPYPVRLRVDNPEYIKAWHALYGYAYADVTREHAREALQRKLLLMREKGDRYPAWVLDQAGIEIALINGNLGVGEVAPRFRWVPMADALLFPFDQKSKGLQQLLKEAEVDNIPDALKMYETSVVTNTLERWKQAGALAVKIAVAYRRPLDFTEANVTDAERIYAQYVRTGESPAADYKVLQNYLFYYLAREAGRIGLVVHIHTGIGANPYFNIRGSNPLLLETALNHSSLRKTNFVLVHGGWPFEKQTGVMLIKPNVYADFSAQTFLRSTRALSNVLRSWLEWYPEKVLFGTDAYSESIAGSDTPLADWEEKIWLATSSSREALAVALIEMMKDGEITRERALELAHMVLRENAIGLYGLAIE